jgi:hypothetical protein
LIGCKPCVLDFPATGLSVLARWVIDNFQVQVAGEELSSSVTNLDRVMNLKLMGLFLFMALAVSAQTNVAILPASSAVVSAATPQSSAVSTNQIQSLQARAEQIRADCIQGRRSICGKILKVLPDGLVVDSGYTNLLRYPLDRSWLVPGVATASRAPNLVEGREPGSICVGLVFLTHTPKSRRTIPKQYDYVIIQGYPAGDYTYKSIGTIERTVRRFSASLSSAVAFRLQAGEKIATSVSDVK